MNTVISEKQLSVNKSKSYLLPLVDDYEPIKFVHLLVNTFLFIEGSTYNVPVIGLLYKFDPDIVMKEDGEDDGFIYYEDKLKKSKYFIEYRELGDYSLFVLEIPEEIQFEYACFIEGMYSKYRKESKTKIAKFLTTHYSRESKPIIDIIMNVLRKSEILRKQLSKELAYEIPEDMELSSKVDKDRETLKFNERD